jgi:uncharacterized protein
MSAALALALAGVFAGSLTQSATGFGFALLSVPVLSATLGPVVAVSTATVLGVLVNALTLGTERRRRAVLQPVATVLVVASVPGMALGAVLLATAPPEVLRALIAAAVLAAVALNAVGGRRAAAPRPATVASVARVGALAGAMGASTGLNGPPLVLHLLRRGARPHEMRDTLAVFFLVTGLLTIAALAVAHTLRLPSTVLALAVAAVAGQLLGRFAFAALRRHHRAVTFGVLAVSAATALVSAVAALV